MARRIKALRSAYADRLGDAATDPSIAGDLKRLVEIEALVESHRNALLLHTPIADPAITVRYEGIVRRLKRELGLNGKRPPPPPMSIIEYANLCAERAAAAKREKAAARAAKQAAKQAAQ
jgi:hypothetical protein